MILNEVYEPIFSDRSHGFRRGRSCHTALDHVRKTWKGVKWLIEVDVEGYFDNISHEKLLSLLERRIDDRRFTALISAMLKAGYLEQQRFHETYSGTPQGGIVSPCSRTSTCTSLTIMWKGSSLASTRVPNVANRRNTGTFSAVPSTPGSAWLRCVTKGRLMKSNHGWTE